MKRTATILILFALAPLLMGGGGSNPGVPSTIKFTGPTISASIVVDPHDFMTNLPTTPTLVVPLIPAFLADATPLTDKRGNQFMVVALDPLPPHGVLPLPVTTTAKQASIFLQKGNSTSGAVFNIVPGLQGFPLFRGCDPSLTTTRFVNTSLTKWVSSALVNQLFLKLGVDLTNPPNQVALITDVVNVVCTPDPTNPGSLANGGDGGSSMPGMLSFQAVIQVGVKQ